MTGHQRALPAPRIRRVLNVVLVCLAALGAVASPAASAAAFDHAHAQWDALLKQHVAWTDGGHASRVDYRGFGADHTALRSYLAGLSAVARSEYDSWTRQQRLAFLIDAYNAFTVELILTKYPDLTTIRDLGSFVRSPWKKKFFMLLGVEMSLDDIEQGTIRARGAFDEPRIHMAVNCASIGCPALRPEAFVDTRLDAQLDDSVRRFLGDRTRNRVDGGVLRVSKIFDWYAADFSNKAGSVAKWLAGYAAQLADDAANQQAVRDARLKLEYLDYDWSLNAVR